MHYRKRGKCQVKTTVCISEENDLALRKLAKQTELSMTYHINKAIAELAEKHGISLSKRNYGETGGTPAECNIRATEATESL